MIFSDDTVKSSPKITKLLEEFKLPLNATDFTELFGDFDSFVTGYARKVRYTQTQIANYNQTDVDEFVMDALSPCLPDLDKAQAAFNAYAWLTMCSPFQHSDRAFYQDMGKLAEAIELHPDYLYRYAIFFAREPSKEIYDKINKFHPPTAKQYWNYCIGYTVAGERGYDLLSLTNW